MTGVAGVGGDLGSLLAGGHLAVGLVIGAVVGVLLLAAPTVVTHEGGRAGRGGRARPLAAWALSALAAAGAYACTPDTEAARGVVGFVVGAGAVAVVAGLDWWWPSHAVGLALVWVAIGDASSRASAVVATLAIAVLHTTGQVLLRRHVAAPVVVVVVAVAIGVCSRAAGLADTAEGALLVVAITGTAAAAALAFAAAHRPSPEG